MSEQQEESIQPKKYIRNFTEEGREKQKLHLENIRQKAMEKKYRRRFLRGWLK